MATSVSIEPSKLKTKKYTAIFFNKNGDRIKSVHFGAKGYGDFTIYSKTSDETARRKKEQYIARHKVNEDWTDPMTAGTLSRYILWNKPTVKASITDYLKRFKLKLKK